MTLDEEVIGKEFQRTMIEEQNVYAIVDLRRALIGLATAVRSYDDASGPAPNAAWAYSEEGKAFITMFDAMLDAEHVAGLWDGDRMGEGYVGGTREAAITAALEG